MELVKVIAHEGQPMADSRDVAKGFGKEHYVLLRTVRRIQKDPAFYADNFVGFEIKDLAGTSTSHFMMTYDGFMVLVMGFAGEKALRLKIAWVKEFNRMRDALRGPALPDFSDEVVAAREWANQREQARIAQTKLIETEKELTTIKQVLIETQTDLIETEKELFEAEPKVKAYEGLMDAHGTFSLTTAMKILGVKPRIGMKWLEGKDDPRLATCLALRGGNRKDPRGHGHTGYLSPIIAGTGSDCSRVQ